jgi:hypothetical protein
MNRRSLFARLASAAAGVFLASSMEVMGFSGKIEMPQETIRLIQLMTNLTYGPIIHKSHGDNPFVKPCEPDAPDGYHIVEVESFGQGKDPVWIDSPAHGEGMGYWSILRHALPEGISMEEYSKVREPMSLIVFKKPEGSDEANPMRMVPVLQSWN